MKFRVFFVFEGNLDVHVGTPHKSNGRQNIEGNLRAFTTKQKRDDFIADHSSNYSSIVITTKHKAKVDYFAGISQVMYDDYVEFTVLDRINKR